MMRTGNRDPQLPNLSTSGTTSRRRGLRVGTRIDRVIGDDRVAMGQGAPIGARVVDGGVNFSVFSRRARGMELLLFDAADDARPAHVVTFDPAVNRSYHYWHTFVPGVGAGQTYGYRAAGAFEPSQGLRFDSSKVLLDPYGRGVVIPKNYDREQAMRAGDNAAVAMKSVVVDPSAYDWEGDAPL